jgi:hypothetical protein
VEIGQRMGLKPWQLVGGSRLLWYVRYEVIRDMEIKRMAKERNKPDSLDNVNARQRRK